MSSLRERVRSGERLLGTFVKTPAHHQVELLGRAGLDFLVADAEHAPVDLAVMDRFAVAASSVAVPLLVRVPSSAPPGIAAMLDIGAAGILVPHVRDAAEAEAVLDASDFCRGRRGFSPSPRGGGYGTQDAVAYRRRADAERVVMAQIEDAEALDHLDDIAAIEALDVLFIGPADLALSLGCDRLDDARVSEAISAVAEAGRRHRRTVGIFIGRPEQAKDFAALGISVFVCGSDQSFLIAEARRVAGIVRDI